MRARWTRRILIVLLAWAVLTVLGSWATNAAWVGNEDGARVASNVAWVAALPGWLAAVILSSSSVRTSPTWIVLANAGSWAGWGVMVLAGWWVFDRIIGENTFAQPTQTAAPANPSRRVFLTQAAVGACGVGAFSTTGYATLIEPWSLHVRRYTVPIKDLPEALGGLRIVQISDTHLGPKIPESFINQVVQRAIGLAPDLFVHTGDYIYHGKHEIDRAAELLAPLAGAAPLGVFGVLGNHDWYGDGPAMSRALTRAGVTMIDNDRVWLDGASRRLVRTRPAGEALVFAGLGDLTEDTIDTRRALGGIDPTTPRVLLAHQPDTGEIGRLTGPGSPRVDLMLSGHTHGGQVRLPLLGTPIIPSRYGQKYAGGLVSGPAFPVLVSRGVGMSGIPVRIGVPPEIGLITLSRA